MARTGGKFEHRYRHFPPEKIAARTPQRVILVTYDGERTEAEYFQGWQRRLGRGAATILPYHVKSGGNVRKAVQATEKVIIGDTDVDEVWCVCDADDTSAEDMKAAIFEAKKAGINLCISRRSFEVWLALHWEKISTREILSESEAISLVAKNYSSYCAKRKTIPFSELEPRTRQACENAEWLAKQGLLNPQTDVHLLVRKLYELL